MEIELRAKCDEIIENNVAKLKAVFVKEKIQRDEYFKFGLDKERKLVMRIRETKGEEPLLTFKGSSKLPDDVAWQEWETAIKEPESLRKLLLSNGLVSVVRINKHRKTFKHGDIEVNVDKIEGLGTFVEAELHSNDPEAAKEKLEEFLFKRLGINQSSIVREGYVPLMLRQMQEKTT